MDDVATTLCPWCFEALEVWVDPETEGVMVQDCDVCCRPCTLHVSWDDEGLPTVHVERAQ